MTEKTSQNQVIIYDDRIDVRFEGETVWLSIEQMADLFQKSRSTINEHILNIYKEKELLENESMRKIGNSDFSTKPTNFYNLDIIISVGYRVKSVQGTQFRQWAIQRLKEKQAYETWNKQKQEIHFDGSSKKNFYKEGQIRWVYFGKNINSEIFGKSEVFSRPALVFKKIYGHSCIAIPLTSQEKKGSYYFSFQDLQEKKHCAIFSQVRYVDGKRIGDKLGSVSKKTFQSIEKRFVGFIKNIPT